MSRSYRVAPFVSRQRRLRGTVSLGFLALGALLAVSTLPARGATLDSGAACAPGHASCDSTSAATCGCRPGDQIWLLSTRGRCCGDGRGVEALQVMRFDSQAGWTSDKIESLTSGENAAMPTVVWIHGYRVESAQAFDIGLSAYRQLIGNAGCDCPPLRFIIWSWPSNSTDKLMRDIRAKAQRALLDAYFLAQLVDRLPHQTPICLVGYSYGARIACGTPHLLAGGTLLGNALEHADPHRAPLNLVVMAAALDSDWLAEGHTMGLALSHSSRMLAVDDPNDRVLEHYRLLYRCGDATALGYTGPYGLSSEQAAKVSLACIYAREHSWTNYIFSPQVAAQVRPYVCFQPIDGLTAQSKPAKVVAAKAASDAKSRAAD